VWRTAGKRSDAMREGKQLLEGKRTRMLLQHLYTLTTRSTSSRQTGHRAHCEAHGPHAAWCPHGVNRWSFGASRHTLHRCASSSWPAAAAAELAEVAAAAAGPTRPLYGVPSGLSKRTGRSARAGGDASHEVLAVALRFRCCCCALLSAATRASRSRSASASAVPSTYPTPTANAAPAATISPVTQEDESVCRRRLGADMAKRTACSPARPQVRGEESRLLLRLGLPDAANERAARSRFQHRRDHGSRFTTNP